jgi:hypothetical protein
MMQMIESSGDLGPTLIRLSAPSPIKGEGNEAASSQSVLLPLWEKVPEGRMRGEPLALAIRVPA